MRLAAVTLVAHSVNVFRDVESEASEPDASGFLEHVGVEAVLIVISEFFTSVSFLGFGHQPLTATHCTGDIEHRAISSNEPTHESHHKKEMSSRRAQELSRAAGEETKQ